MGTNFRWVVPQLSPEVWSRKEAYKAELLDRLRSSKTARKGIMYYSIAIESHADGNPHLDLLLIFEKQIRMSYTELDFLCQKHGDLTRYRNLNHAIVQYGSKEDTPLSNFKSKDVETLLFQKRLTKDPYLNLELEMRKDPLNFDLLQFVSKNNLLSKIKGWSAVKTKLKDAQTGYANLQLKNKPGIKKITPDLIKKTLSLDELRQFESWSGYCRICTFINEINEFGSNRPFKSKQLLLVGPPNTGKTSLNREIAKWVPTYQVGMSHWWPEYRDNVYRFFSWNEFSLSKMPYTELLKLLEGTPLNLQKKGSHAPRFNNQLIIMNSNVDIVSQLRRKFNIWTEDVMYREALKNFPARVEQITIPPGYKLFLLLKLIIPNNPSNSDNLSSSDLSCTL